MSDFKLGDYVQVDERIAQFREAHPEGCLQPVNPREPYTVEVMPDESVYIVYTAAAYRHPDDALPGIGCAWEPFPGKTPYTRNSELMNAETSAWGRAIVAALAADAKRGIATAEEVRNRVEDREADPDPPKTRKAPQTASGESSSAMASEKQVKLIHVLAKKAGYDDAALKGMLKVRFKTEHVAELRKSQASSVIEGLQKHADEKTAEEQVGEELKQAGFEELGEEVPF